MESTRVHTRTSVPTPTFRSPCPSSFACLRFFFFSLVGGCGWILAVFSLASLFFVLLFFPSPVDRRVGGSSGTARGDMICLLLVWSDLFMSFLGPSLY